jgi:plasmid segregation protein ParM
MKLGVDAGNNEVKIYGEEGAFKYPSILGEYRERKLTDSFSTGDIIYEFKGRKGFAGKLAEIESEFSGSIVGTTKAHEDTLIRVLLGIAQYESRSVKFDIVVGQPIEQHTDEEKKRIKKLLIGDHGITINDQKRNIYIERVEVAAEGGVAYWSSPRKGLVRILDFGSGTVNGATLLDAKYVDRDSFTIGYGLGTVRATNREAFMRSVYIKTQEKRWNKSDVILVTGGDADGMIKYVNAHFENAEILRPQDHSASGIKIVLPIFANAIGMYNVAKEVFK